MAVLEEPRQRAGGEPRRRAVAVLLAWLVPGLGHFYLGWRRRAALHGGVVVFMFVLGLVLQGGLSHPQPGSYLSLLATIADLGAGALYFVADWSGWAVGRVGAATHEIGNTFHWSAGVMNMLLVLDAHDIAVGRKTAASPAAP